MIFLCYYTIQFWTSVSAPPYLAVTIISQHIYIQFCHIHALSFTSFKYTCISRARKLRKIYDTIEQGRMSVAIRMRNRVIARGDG